MPTPMRVLRFNLCDDAVLRRVVEAEFGEDGVEEGGGGGGGGGGWGGEGGRGWGEGEGVAGCGGEEGVEEAGVEGRYLGLEGEGKGGGG